MRHAFWRGRAQHFFAVNFVNPETRTASNQVFQVDDLIGFIMLRAIDRKHAPILTAAPGAVLGREIEDANIARLGLQSNSRNLAATDTPSFFWIASVLLQIFGI